jgi:hypothetical protein
MSHWGAHQGIDPNCISSSEHSRPDRFRLDQPRSLVRPRLVKHLLGLDTGARVAVLVSLLVTVCLRVFVGRRNRWVEGNNRSRERGEESLMRRLYYRDSYGRWHEDRHAEGRSGTPAKWAVITLLLLAGFVVVASMIH